MDCEFECQARAKQHIDLVEVSPHIQLSGQFLETVEKFYVGGKKELKGGAVECYRKNQVWIKQVQRFSIFVNQNRFALRSERLIKFCMCIYMEVTLDQFKKKP